MSAANDANIEYIDWNNAFEILDKAFKLGIFVLIIGPKGTGKTTLVRKFAKQVSKELSSVNFSLRTRESHLIGTNTIDNGQINFVNGVLVHSMTQGDLLYLDELNAAEPDVLLRLDEALDDRRQIVLKEFHGKKVGQLLYEKAMQIARQKNADYVWLGVWEENPRAINFYKKNGFVEFDKHIFKLGNDEQTDIMMKLQLKD